MVSLSKLNISLNAMFINYQNKWITNGVYLQECIAAFLGSENYTGGVTKIFEIYLLRTWFVYIERAVSPISAAQPLLFFAFAER